LQVLVGDAFRFTVKHVLERRAECHVGALDRNRRDLDIEARRELFRVRDGVPDE